MEKRMSAELEKLSEKIDQTKELALKHEDLLEKNAS